MCLRLRAMAACDIGRVDIAGCDTAAVLHC